MSSRMPLAILGLFSPVYASQFLFLTFRVIRQRFRSKTSLSDGSYAYYEAKKADNDKLVKMNWALLSAVRAQANFIESVPLALVLLGALELNGAPRRALVALHAVLVAARMSHVWAMTRPNALSPTRPVGMIGTQMVMLVASIWNAVLGWS